MPTYDYQCGACEHRFEEFQSITANPLKKCPACGKLKLQRLIGTGGGILFKGSGFYETDYRSESYKKAAEADRKAGSDGKQSGGGQSDGGQSKGSPSDAGKSSGGSGDGTKKKSDSTGSGATAAA